MHVQQPAGMYPNNMRGCAVDYAQSLSLNIMTALHQTTLLQQLNAACTHKQKQQYERLNAQHSNPSKHPKVTGSLPSYNWRILGAATEPPICHSKTYRLNHLNPCTSFGKALSSLWCVNLLCCVTIYSMKHCK